MPARTLAGRHRRINGPSGVPPQRELLREIGLGEIEAGGGQSRGIGRNVARGDDEAQIGPAIVHQIGKRDTIHRAGHVHIGEQDVDIVAFVEDAERLPRIGGFDHVEAAFLKAVGGEDPDQHLILDNEDGAAGHGVHAATNPQEGAMFRREQGGTGSGSWRPASVGRIATQPIAAPVRFRAISNAPAGGAYLRGSAASSASNP
jgi:hypothetical protein